MPVCLPYFHTIRNPCLIRGKADRGDTLAHKPKMPKINHTPNQDKSKPILLKALEMIIADPAQIKREATSLLSKYEKRYKEDRTNDDIRELVANKIIQNYSYMAAFSGGVTALAGVVPGLGTVVASSGGATADIAL